MSKVGLLISLMLKLDGKAWSVTALDPGGFHRDTSQFHVLISLSYLKTFSS